MNEPQAKWWWMLYRENGELLAAIPLDRPLRMMEVLRDVDGQNWRVWYLEEHPGRHGVARLESVGAVEAGNADIRMQAVE